MVINGQLYVDPESVNLKFGRGHTVLRTVNHPNQDHPQYRSGFHFGTFNADESNDSIFNVRYTRVQNCGQNNVMGRYCFHFHLKKKCPSCTVVGNAVVNSIQGAIVVHGTHQRSDSNSLQSTVKFTAHAIWLNPSRNEVVVYCQDILLWRFRRLYVRTYMIYVFLVLKNSICGLTKCHFWSIFGSFTVKFPPKRFVGKFL